MSETERVTYVPCTRCATNQVMKPLSIEEDPVCMSCLRELAKIAADKTYEKKEPRICIHPVCNNTVTAGTSDYCTPCIQEFVRIAY